MKTIEELLIKRYKCIAPIPFQPFPDMYNVGDIFTDNGKTAILNQKGDPVCVVEWDKYPHLFQLLPWWSDREVDEMPAFVKSIKQEYDHGVEIGKVIKVKGWVLLSETMYVIQSKTREYHPSCFVPATREEYELFKQKP